MIKFFRRLLGLRPDKDTDACRLKEELHSNVVKLKEKAAAGDSSATLKLGALRESLSEQSIRLNKGVKAIAILVLMVLALGVEGCSFSREERKDFVENIVTIVEARAISEVTKDLVKEGVDPVQAKKVSELAMRKLEEIIRKLIE